MSTPSYTHEGPLRLDSRSLVAHSSDPPHRAPHLPLDGSPGPGTIGTGPRDHPSRDPTCRTGSHRWHERLVLCSTEELPASPRGRARAVDHQHPWRGDSIDHTLNLSSEAALGGTEHPDGVRSVWRARKGAVSRASARPGAGKRGTRRQSCQIDARQCRNHQRHAAPRRRARHKDRLSRLTCGSRRGLPGTAQQTRREEEEADSTADHVCHGTTSPEGPESASSQALQLYFRTQPPLPSEAWKQLTAQGLSGWLA